MKTFHSTVARGIAAAALAIGLAGEARGIVVFDRIRIENSRQQLTFMRGKRRNADALGGMGLQSVRDLTSGARFDTIYSPLFQVELRGLDPTAAPTVRVPEGALNFTLLPIEQTALDVDPLVPNSARLTWTDVPVPNSTQLLQVVVEVYLRSTDGKAVWNIWSWLTGDGPYAIHIVRFPYFGLNGIGADGGEDDDFLIPFTSGQVVRNPIAVGNSFPERVPDEDSASDAYFTYPGSVMSQFMAYYDATAGFYMQAEDTSGRVKNLYFDKAHPVINPNATRLMTYFTHFNTAPAPTNGESTAQIHGEMTYFSLGDVLGYTVSTDVFTGDWFDAASLYRQWVQSSGAPWVSRGPLATRTDLPFRIKDTAYALRWQLPDVPDAIDPAAEADKMQHALAFYDSFRQLWNPGNIADFVPLSLISHAQTDSAGRVIDIGDGDDYAEPLRPGVAEFLYFVQHPPPLGLPVRAVALNRDTSGIRADSPNAADVLLNGAMRKPDLTPASGGAGLLRTCLGSSWLVNRRTQIVQDTIIHSYFGGSPGFTMAALTGTGNFGFNCYAPMQDDPAVVDRARHMHDVGGGNYLRNGWLQLAANMDAMAATLHIPFIILGMEHTPETFINEYILVGRSLCEPFDDTQSGVGRTLAGAVPVPLFKVLYHDYNLWPANPPMTSDIVAEYVDETHPLADNLLARFRMAQLGMQGRLLKYRLSQDDDATYDGSPETLPPEVQDEHAYFAAIATLRVFADQYLVFGQALRDPVVVPTTPDDSTPIRFLRLGAETIVDEPRIVASAWQDLVGNDVGLVFTNFTPRVSQCSFTFRPSDYSLAPGVVYKLQFAELDGSWTDVSGVVFDGSQGSVTLGPITVAAMDDFVAPPWSVYRIVPM
ncbi:MAG: hypothetical protein HYR85_05810 [Planctomycetes bacterium]|nr:hypothetical protein [Planctomycetota bacterium]